MLPPDKCRIAVQPGEERHHHEADQERPSRLTVEGSDKQQHDDRNRFQCQREAQGGGDTSPSSVRQIHRCMDHQGSQRHIDLPVPCTA